MSRYYTHLNTAKHIIEKYDGGIPLSAWLKDFFRLHKQMGSRDRKTISSLVYCFYRLGHSTTGMSVEERILLGVFLCHQSSHEILHHLRPDWNDVIELSLQDKIKHSAISTNGFQFNNIFSWYDELSVDVDVNLFNRSFLQQPDLFIGIRPGKEISVLKKLDDAGIPFHTINNTCIALPNATKIDDIIELDNEAVIQDYNSQQTGSFFPFSSSGFQLPAANAKLRTLNPDRAGASPAPTSILPSPDSRLPTPDSLLQTLNSEPRTLQVWDCCAASGGKSIMAKDLDADIQLTVSDVRESILHNLHRRFQKAGIKNYEWLLTDLSAANCRLPGKSFDMIIADLPCTGSGTWARTPEQLYFFKPDSITYYSDLQKKIIRNVVPALQKGGCLVYITCSVFKKENEEQVNFIQQNFNLQLLRSALLKGYDIKADSMFVAVFER